MPGSFRPLRSCRVVPLLGFCVVCAAGPALGQQAEQITVVPAAGARSPGVAMLGSADIARSGQSSIGDLLDALPSFGSQGINDAQTDGGFGEHFIDLRNLNFDRTLVLVDGNRFVVSGIQTDEAVDLNGIPAAFVDHIEVMKDGTQPRYAADAVAGVVNVVLKDQVDGLHIDAYGGAAGAGDSGTVEVSLVGGRGFAGGHVAFGVDVYRHDPVLQSDRGWAADPIADATGGAGGGALYGSPAAAGGHAVSDGVDALALGGGRSRAFNDSDDYNTALARDLTGSLQRETVYFDGDASVTDDIRANAELLYNERTATTVLPPAILGLTGTAKYPDGFVVPAADPFNPFGTAVSLERVVREAGAQSTTTSGPVWRVLGGLDGTIGRWDWSLSFDHGQSLSRYAATNQIDLTRALASVDGCAGAAGCVAADWFGPGSLSAQALRNLAYTGRSQSAYTETVGQGRFDGSLFRLPGGPALLSVGGEVRSEAGATTVPPVTAMGDQAGEDAAATSGGYDTYEAYVSLSLPLLRGVRFADRLELSGSARETATSRYGSFSALRGALDYAPVRGLHVRAVSGTSRRPPAISEAFGGITASPQPVTDPCDASSGLRANPVVAANCRAQGLGAGFNQASPLIEIESGGNPSLHPEESENEEVSVSLDPPSLPFLSANVAWYRYRIRDAIDSLADTDPNLIGDSCYASAHLSSPLCGLITRIAGGGNAGQISNILGLDENVGTIKTSGVDFGLTLDWKSTPLGRIKLDWQTTWLLDYRISSIGQAGFTQYAGSFPGLNAVGSYARVRSRATADLEHGPWSFGWTGRFISGARVLGDGAGDPYGKAPGILYQDIEVSRRIDRITAMAGVDNVADVRPPTLVDGETNTDTSTYDVVGRFVWGRVSLVF